MTDAPSAGNGHLRAGAVLSKLSWGVCSDTGPTRQENEDFAGVFAPTIPDDAWDRGPLFVVADGLGGHAAGEVASRIAVESTLHSWTNGEPGDPLKSLRSALRRANVAVLDESFSEGRSGMATTLTALTLAGREAIVGHVGDSRAYLVRGESCTQLTVDHSRVSEMLRMKLLTPEQAARHPARNQLTRTVGTDPTVQVDVTRQALDAADSIVLCTDGLWSEVTGQEIADVAGRIGSPVAPTALAAAEALVDLAIKRGAADNVTAVVVRVSSGLPIPSAGARRKNLFRRGRA